MKLTAKQELFAVEYILNGRNASEAYRKHYNTKLEGNALWVNAHKALHSANVSLRIKELLMVSHSKHVITIEERKRLLTSLSFDGDIKAIDLLNKMENVYDKDQSIDIDESIDITFRRVKSKKDI